MNAKSSDEIILSLIDAFVLAVDELLHNQFIRIFKRHLLFVYFVIDPVAIVKFPMEWRRCPPGDSRGKIPGIMLAVLQDCGFDILLLW